MTLGIATLKENLDLRNELAQIPPILRGVFFLSSDDSSALTAFTEQASSIPEVAEMLCQTAVKVCSGYPVEAVADAVALLGVEGVRNVLVEELVPRCFAQAELGSFSSEAHWEQARNRARYAQAIAHKLDTPFAEHAYCAAFLQDIGQPVLALLWPVQYEKVRGNSFARGIHLLEAEMAELGVDHALVGKRLAEAWRLPQHYIDLLWLHHHPPVAVYGTGKRSELLDIVAVATHFADTEKTTAASDGSLPDHIGVRLNRLGINAAQVCEWIAASPEETQTPSQASTTFQVPQATRQENHAEKRYEALRGLLLDCVTEDDPGEVLTAIAKAVRTAFRVPAGLCFTTVPGSHIIESRLWRGVESHIESEQLSLDMDESVSKHTALAQLLARLGDELQSPVAHQGLFTLPMTVGGVSHGQIALDFSASGSSPTQDTITELYRFTEICGSLLARCNAQVESRDKAEHFATALWRQESAIERRLQAERLAGVQQLAAGAAHEINNPLAVISGRAQILLSRANGEEDSKALDTIVRQCRRVTQILTDLMQFAKPSEAKFDLVLVHYLLHQILASRRGGLAAKGIRVVEDFDEHVPRLRIDPHQMQRVFLNVLLNAEEAMTRSGSREGGHILTVRTRVVGGSVEVRVEDTGPGIPVAIQDEVFDPFFTTKDVGQGTGLGLAVCYGTVRAHGGTMHVESVPGRGCSMVITLPAVQSTEIENAPVSIVENMESTPKKKNEAPQIILAESDADLAAILMETLSHRGIKTRTVRDGLNALAMLAAGEPDLLLMSQQLRGVNGGTLFDEVRQRYPELPIIVLLGAVDDTEPEDLLDAGAAACLRKPFEMAKLIAEIRQVVAIQNVA